MQTRRMLEIETPEAVAVRYPLASYGSRGTAAIIDMSLIFLAIAVEVLLGSFLLNPVADAAPQVFEFIYAWVWAFIIGAGVHHVLGLLPLRRDRWAGSHARQALDAHPRRAR